MDLNYPEAECYSNKSSSSDDMGIGRSYECIFCKRGFTTAQALGGHMNIHRKERANKTKPTTFSPPSNKLHDDGGGNNNNYADLGLIYSQLPSQYNSTAPAAGVDANNSYRDLYFPSTVRPSNSHEENQRGHVFAQDWRKRSLSLYTNPLCFHEIKDKFEESEENGLDLELRLGHYP